MIITEYTPIALEGNGHTYYSIKLGENIFYKTYDSDEGIKITYDIGFASRISNERFALEVIGFLQNFFDETGKIRPENRNKVIPPLVGVQEAAEILGWDRRKVSTYMSRGVFPEPIQRLASGSIWTRKQIEDYKDSRS